MLTVDCEYPPVTRGGSARDPARPARPASPRAAAPTDAVAPGPGKRDPPNGTDPRTALEAVRTASRQGRVGQDSVVTGLVICLLCRGHVLLEGVPGVARRC